MNSVLILCLLALGIGAVVCGDIRDDPVLKQESNRGKDGVFHYHYETGKGSVVTQDGHLKAEHDEVLEGEYKYIGDDGRTYDIQYTADENGYHPHGDSIPTPPPIPEAIIRALDYISKHPYVTKTKPQ